MKQAYFKNVTNIGTLYLEKVFLRFEEENILFICRDEQNNRYLCVCYEMRYELCWILCKVTKETILQMLFHSISVREVYEKASEPLILITYTEESGELSEEKLLQDIAPQILPDADFFMKYDMKSDVYYLNICLEMFKEHKSFETFLTMEPEPLPYNTETFIMPKVSFTSHNQVNYVNVPQNVNEELVFFCA